MNGWRRFIVLLPAALVAAAGVRAQTPDPPGQVRAGDAPKFEAYLFAHMIEGCYGRMCYSVSRDGLHWTLLNQGRPVFDGYLAEGFP